MEGEAFKRWLTAKAWTDAAYDPRVRAIAFQTLLVLALLVLAVEIVLNTAANLLPLNGQTTGEVSDRFPVLVTPPGYVFGIWGLALLEAFVRLADHRASELGAPPALAAQKEAAE